MMINDDDDDDLFIIVFGEWNVTTNFS